MSSLLNIAIAYCLMLGWLLRECANAPIWDDGE